MTKSNLPVLMRKIYATILIILVLHIFSYCSYILYCILYKPEALVKIRWDKSIVSSQLNKKCNSQMRVIVNTCIPIQ